MSRRWRPRRRNRDQFGKRRLYVGKGLTRKAALSAMLRDHPGDFRGFVYNAKSGIAQVT